MRWRRAWYLRPARRRFTISDTQLHREVTPRQPSPPAGTPQGGEDGRTVSVAAVDVVNPKDAVVDLELALDHAALADGGDVYWVLPGAGRVIPAIEVRIILISRKY